MFRSLLSLLLLTASIAAQVSSSSEAHQSALDRTRSVSTFRSASRLVNVFVVATDHEGHFVSGLKPDDFQILDDGHAQKTAFFASAADKSGQDSSLHPVTSGEYTNDLRRRGLPAQSATVVLFDTINTAYLSQAYSLGKIRAFLRQLQPEDHIGIYVLTVKGLKVVYDIAQPASGLLQAMQRYDERHNHGATTHTDESTDGTGSPELDRFLRGKDNHRRVSRCDTGTTEVTIAAVQQIARSMAGFSGRKSIVWVTEHLGLPLEWDNAFSFVSGRFCGFGAEDSELLIEDPANLAPFETVRRPLTFAGNTNTKQMGRSTDASTYLRDRGLTEYDEIDLMLRLLNKNNISLYPVSAEGLQTVRLFGSFGMDSTVSVVADPSGITNRVLTAEEAVSNQESHQAMERLARHTGGRALHDRNDIETGIRRALGDAENGYELAYYPDHDHWNGDWHKIQVKVNRSGAAVLARAGYYAFPDVPVLLPKAREQLLTEIAASPLEDTEIPITVQVNSPSGASPPVLQPRVYLSANDLLHRQSDGWQSNFEVLFFQLTAANAILDVTTQNASVELTDANYAEVLKRGIKTSERLELKPGAALLYVIVHDKTSDSVGSVRIPLGEYTSAMQRTGLRR